MEKKYQKKIWKKKEGRWEEDGGWSVKSGSVCGFEVKMVSALVRNCERLVGLELDPFVL